MTAILENINPYSKFGLRRRATYDEIANLIGENEKLTGELPNRDATFFKASPEGSFFDGMDSLEVLKEQQNRIHKRQLQELLLRQNPPTLPRSSQGRAAPGTTAGVEPSSPHLRSLLRLACRTFRLCFI